MLAVTRLRELSTGIALAKVTASSQMRRVVQQQLIVCEQLIFEFLRPDHGDRTSRTEPDRVGGPSSWRSFGSLAEASIHFAAWRPVNYALDVLPEWSGPFSY